MQGFLNINKAPALTSHDVVAQVRRLVGRGVKVGHAGTLDPMATGVLPVALGPATRLIEYLADARKGYRALVAPGITTTTDDAEGEPVEQRPLPPLDRAMVEAALIPFRGTIMQVPPMYSAIHHQGQRLYDLARRGETVAIEPRQVTIDRLELAEMTEHTLTLEVVCSKGTYIRALARDLGQALGCGAHLAALQRTFVGSFSIEQAVSLPALQQVADVQAWLLPPEIAVSDWPAVTLSAAQIRRVCNGQSLTLPDLAGDQARAHTDDGTLLALLRRSGDLWQPEKVFATGGS